jgi:hypothetical protein
MTAGKGFFGFVDADKDAAIIMRTMPAAAFPEIEKTINSAAIEARGVTVEQRDTVATPAGKGILIMGRQVAEKKSYRKWLLFATAGAFTALVTAQVPEAAKAAYPDDIMRAALTSLAVRASVPDAEKLALVPFKLNDLGGFHVEAVVPGRAVILTDAPAKAGPTDASKSPPPGSTPPRSTLPARFLVAAVPGGPSESADRSKFARIIFGDVADIKDVRITVSEPLRLNNQYGHQIMADAKDSRTGVAIKVVQWLRFGGSAFLQFVGIAPAAGWVDTLAHMRTVRDNLDTP